MESPSESERVPGILNLGNSVPTPSRETSSAAQPASQRYSRSPIIPLVALTGNPNSGKTTVFNALTGLRAHVGNYAGVTVERKEGRLQGAPHGFPVAILDLPGTYSLSPQSLDEQIARDILFHRLDEVAAPSLVVVVVDASNLERNLYFATQVIELGYPTFIALNMIDVVGANGQQIDATLLEKELGVPVFPLTASHGRGVEVLRKAIVKTLQAGTVAEPRQFYKIPETLETEASILARLLESTPGNQPVSALAEALLLLSHEKFVHSSDKHYSRAILEAIHRGRKRLEAAGIDWRSVLIEARYDFITHIRQAVLTETRPPTDNLTDRLDRYLTHRVWGLLFFVVIMASMFLGIFTLARIPMDALQALVSWIGDQAATLIPPGELQNLVVRGMIQGVGAVVVFLPQICLLFLFIGLLEDTGYMARAAFLMDRLMSRVGLHGKSFIPMLSSFACAIPGIMATRTIETPKDRLVTILIAPLMSCSARLPVYVLLIAACFPGRQFLAGFTMFMMYLLGIVMALAMATLFKNTLLRGETPILVMELPPYKRPLLRVVLRQMWDRSKQFLYRAGTVILGINILLWFLASYPKHADVEQRFAQKRVEIEQQANAKALTSDAAHAQLTELNTAEAGERLRGSFAGMLGRALEPVIAPLGFDWKIGIGLVSSFAAREVFVSTMAIVYNVESSTDSGVHSKELAQVMRQQKRPDGSPVFTTLTTLTLMVFYVLALQCISTIAIVHRETNSWKWPVFQWCYMTVLAWGMAFLTYHGGRWLGF